MPKVTPFLWFEDNAEAAIDFYKSTFKNVKVGQLTSYGDDVPGPKGKVTSATIEIEGQKLMIFNGGPVEGFKFSPAISLFVSCDTQAEIDDLWTKLSSGGKEIQCGWLTDKFGLTWQIVPSILGDLLSGPDKDKAKRVTQAMLKMVKLDINKLKQAAEE